MGVPVSSGAEIREGSLLCVTGFVSRLIVESCIWERNQNISEGVSLLRVCDLPLSLWSSQALFFTAFSLTLGLVEWIINLQEKKKETARFKHNVGKGKIAPKQSKSSYGRTVRES